MLSKTDVHAIKIILGLLLHVGNLIASLISNPTGVFGIILKIIKLLPEAATAIKAIPEVLPEYQDLTAEEKTEIEAYVVQECDLPQDDIEAMVEAGLCFLVELLPVKPPAA